MLLLPLVNPPIKIFQLGDFSLYILSANVVNKQQHTPLMAHNLFYNIQ